MTKSIIITFGLPFIAILIFCSCENGSKEKKEKKKQDATIEQKTNIVKMHPVLFGGNRYVVEADFGLNEKVPLMIHGNAKMYLMITHDVAEKLNGGNPIEKLSDYGYSKKGRGRIDIENFKIGDKTFSNIQNVPVFDWPEEEGKDSQGMLGTVFLKNENTRIDFTNEQIEIGVKISDKPDKSLLDQGYEFTKFIINENYEVFMNVFFDALQKEIPITISTVSSELSLHVILFKEKIKMKKTKHETNSSGHDSPKGTNVEDFIADSVIYSLGKFTFNSQAELFDFAKYNDVKESDLHTYGIFGRDWMKKNNAIIDYANQILYFKTNTTSDSKVK